MGKWGIDNQICVKITVRKGVEKVLMANKPDDGVTGESTLWKLVQGITAHSRELEPRRQRDLQEIAGDLMNRVKL